MAGDAARTRAVSVRLRRVVPGRAVRRLLVLGGLLIAGWLLGCAAQTAHAGEIPVEPSKVVARTPVLGDAVETVHQREPVRRVVRAVAQKTPDEGRVTPVAPPLPKAPEVGEAARDGGVSATDAPRGREAQRRNHERAAVFRADRPAPADDGHASRQIDQHHPAPVQAPEQPDGHSAAGGSATSGVTAGFPNVMAWAGGPGCASAPCVFGAVPPAVRTAADEPSFAPD